MSEEMKIVNVPVEKIHPHKCNVEAARLIERQLTLMIYKGDDEAEWERREKEILERGITSPVMALRDGTIVSGTYAWVFAQYFNQKTVPVIYVDVKDPDAFMIALNKVR